MLQNTKQETSLELIPVGSLADQRAAANVMKDYIKTKAANTRARHNGDLDRFEDYLGIEGLRLADNPDGWAGVTWGIVKGYQTHLLESGYAISTINGNISTIKTYAKLAYRAGALALDQLGLIVMVEGFTRTAGRNIDQERTKVRRGYKKAEATILTNEIEIDTSTPQGKRDKLLICLLLEHGLRVGEVVGLKIQHFDIELGTLAFYRPKVDKHTTHKLTASTLAAVREYLALLGEDEGVLIRGSLRGGALTARAMSISAINQRIGWLGRKAKIEGLSPHDMRHAAVTRDSRNERDIKWLMDKYGWSSPAMAVRYINDSKIIETE